MPEDWNPTSPFKLYYDTRGFRDSRNTWLADYTGEIPKKIDPSGADTDEKPSNSDNSGDVVDNSSNSDPSGVRSINSRTISVSRGVWRPSWAKGEDEITEYTTSPYKVTVSNIPDIDKNVSDNVTVVVPNKTNVTRSYEPNVSSRKVRGYRAVSADVKSRVLVKFNSVVAALSQEVILGLGRDGDSVDDIIGAGLTKAVEKAKHPELILSRSVDNSGGNNEGDGDVGVKRAVLIGINYSLNDKVDTLTGCINDAMAIRGMLIDSYQYKNENITVLRDDEKEGYLAPTRQNIIQTIKDAVSDNTEKDELWIHYSGLGTSSEDQGNDETDQRDEGIVSSDFNEDTIQMILDDELKTYLNEVKGTVMITQDCRSSGTGWDLPYKYTRQSNGTYKRSIESTTFSQTTTNNIYMLSGSQDDQQAVETGERFGAFTEALIECLRLRNHAVTFFNLENAINSYLADRNIEQRTVFTSSNYNASVASITKSMIMSSNVPPYRR